MELRPLSAALCHAYFQTSSFAVVRSFAQHLHAATQLWTPPFDPHDFIRAMNITVERRPIEAEGFLENWPGNDTRVVVRPLSIAPTDGERRRDRFTLAHELGHFVIRERLLGWYPTERFRIDDPEEEELCNVFAAELLMPTSLIARRFTSARNNPAAFLALCDEYDASLTSLLKHACWQNRKGFLAIVWQRGRRRFMPSWSTPRLTTSVLCETGHTTVERASTCGTVVYGTDTFLIDGERQRWPCGSVRLRNGDVLTIGIRGVSVARYAEPVELQSRATAVAVQLPLRFSRSPIAAAARRPARKGVRRQR
jgi:Predicted Zn peptidase